MGLPALWVSVNPQLSAKVLRKGARRREHTPGATTSEWVCVRMRVHVCACVCPVMERKALQYKGQLNLSWEAEH